MAPYPEETAALLEQMFSSIFSADVASSGNEGDFVGISVDVGQDRKVVYLGDLTFVQQRKDQEVGRKVCRGYEYNQPLPRVSSREELLVQVPRELRARPANPIREMAAGYMDGYSEGAEAARNITTWMGAKKDWRERPDPSLSSSLLPPPSREGAPGESGRTTAAASAQALAEEALRKLPRRGLTRSKSQELLETAGLDPHLDLRTLVRPPPASTVPLSGRGCWHWSRYPGSQQQRFPPEASQALEVAMMRGIQVLHIDLDGLSLDCLVHQRKAFDTERNISCDLTRATWFFQRSNGELEPYEEPLALQLEQAFFGADGVEVMGGGSSVGQDPGDEEERGLPWEKKHNLAVDMGGNRLVCARKGGGFCQARQDNKSARLVVRGFRAKLRPFEQAPHEPYCGWDKWTGEGKISGLAGGAEESAAAKVGRQRTGQSSLDELSTLGLQTLTGAAVDGSTQGTTEQRSYLLKRETDEQLEKMRQTRAETVASLQVAQRDTSDALKVLRVGIEQMTMEAMERFTAAGESLPAGLTPVGKPTMQLVGQLIGFTSVIGSWIVDGTGTVVDTAIGATEKGLDGSMRAGEAALSGVQTVMSVAQTEFVLGVEGAAIMENMLNLHEAEFKHAYSDIGYQQLARGMSAYSALQQLVRPAYVHDGVVDTCGPGLPGDAREVSYDRQTLALWLRYMRLSSCAYGVMFMAATGVTNPQWALLGSERSLFERTGITADKIIHACWESEGYAQPAWILVQDDQTHAVCLVISGSKSNSDWLSNLRCANVNISAQHYGNLPIQDLDLSTKVSVHAGIWAAAVKMDERCLDIVKTAMADRPGWPLVICGHSLGAGTGSLLGMRWRGMGLFPGLKVYAYATPPTVDCEQIVADSHEYITAFQCSDDFVCRWCLGTTLDIAKAGHALATGDEGVVDQLIECSLYGFEDGSGKRDAKGRRTFAAKSDGADEDYAARTKATNKALFDALLKQQKEQGTLPTFSIDKTKPYVLPVNLAKPGKANKEWAQDLLRACEERMDADKLIPLGKCHWMIPILQDKDAFRSRRATWPEIADGWRKCKVSLLNPPNDMFTRMPVNDHLVTDHCPAPYERCLEALLMQAGGAVPDPEGWVALFQERRRTGLAARNAYDIERGAA